LKKRLATLWSRKKITKKAHAGRGHETKWEMSIKYAGICEQNKSAFSLRDQVRPHRAHHMDDDLHAALRVQIVFESPLPVAVGEHGD
jgi:hypothetical protein